MRATARQKTPIFRGPVIMAAMLMATPPAPATSPGDNSATDADTITAAPAADTASVLELAADHADAEPAISLPAAEPAWRFSAGGMLRTFKTREIRSGSFAQDYPLHALAATRVRRYLPAGKADATDMRRYHDGYVRQDEWTDLDGTTWNWGYHDARQVRDNTIRFRWTDRVTTEHHRHRVFETALQTDDGRTESGAYFRAQRTLYRAPVLWEGRLHADLSRTLTSMNGNQTNFRDEQIWLTREHYRMDIYSLEGTGISADSPPYRGNRDDPGPSISNIPLRRQGAGNRITARNSHLAYNRIRHEMDMQLLTFSLAPAISLQYGRWQLNCAAGPTINLIDTDTSYHETLYESLDGGPAEVVHEWRRSRSQQEINFGAFTQLELGIRLTDWLEAGIFGRYDWLENVWRDIGQARHLVNPEGGSLGGVITLLF